MRVRLLGEPPPPIIEATEQAGMQLGPAPEVTLVWFTDAGLPGPVNGPWVALTTEPEHLTTALEQGASAVVLAQSPRSVTLQLKAWARERARLRTERGRVRLLQEQVRDACTLRDRMFNVCPDPVICTDPQGNVLLFNKAAEVSLGFSAEYACAQLHVTDLYANPADARRVLAEIRRDPDHMVKDFEVRLRARSGEQIPVMLSGAEVLDATGMPTSTVGIFRDRRAELSLRSRLQQASRQLMICERQLNAMRVARAAARELNQPLTALMGSLELLDLQSDLSEDVRRRLERMYNQMDRMADIVRGLGRNPSTLDEDETAP